ncbi:MAG: anti-sigma factor [Nitriliruptoraceae bacterium]
MSSYPDLHTLTGAYAVDALPEDERVLFEAHLAVCGACEQEVQELQATAARLGAISVAGPSAGLRGRILTEIDAVRQERPEPVVEAPVEKLAARRAVPRWVANGLGIAAALLLVAVGGLAAVVASLQGQVANLEVIAGTAEQTSAELGAVTERLADLERRTVDAPVLTSSAVTDVLAAPDVVTVSVTHDDLLGRVVASPTRGEAVFIAEGWEPAPHEHTYVLWLITPDGAVPAGLFDPDDQGRATRVMTGDVARATAVGITIEPEGGSPVPSDEPMMTLQLG